MSWIYYLLEANLYLVLFYAVYYLLLRRDTYYQLNRIYLLTSSAIAFVIPLVRLGFLQPTPIFEAVNYSTTAYSTTAIPVPAEIVANAQATAPVNYYLLVYMGIACLMSIAFGIRLYQLAQLARKGKHSAANEFKLVEIEDEDHAFSFFNYLFIGKKLSASTTIIEHELVHIRQKHSIDIVYLELLKIICWFNPVVYLLQNSIKEVHEFIADNQIASAQQDVNYYTDFLISNAYGLPANALTNNFFNKNLLKTRIIMLHQKRSGSLARLKLLVTLPLLAGMLCLSTLGFTKDYSLIDLAPAAQAKQVPPPPPVVVPDTKQIPPPPPKVSQVRFPPPEVKPDAPRRPALLRDYFSPGSGAMLKPKVKVDHLKIQLMNKYGKTIFSFNDENTAWDGMIDGNPAPEGVYYWLAVYNKDGKQVKEKGHVNVIAPNTELPLAPPPPKVSRVRFPPPVVKPDATPPKPKVSQVRFPPPVVKPGAVPPPPKVSTVRFPPPVVKPGAVPPPPPPKVSQVRFPPPVVVPDDTTGSAAMSGINTQLSKTIRYSADARDKNIVGRVWVVFNIDEDRNIRNIKIVKGLTAIQNMEVVNRLRNCFVPAAAKTGVNYTMPITFSLSGADGTQVKIDPAFKGETYTDGYKPNNYPYKTLNEVVIAGYGK